MKRGKKILIIILISGVSLTAILFVLSVAFEKDISSLFMKEVNKRLVTSASAKEINFSLLKRFPHASIELEEVLISTPESFIRKGLEEYSTDTLLYAGRLNLSLKITDILRKNYRIGKIEVQDGKLSLFTDLSGESNGVIWQEKSRSDSSAVSLELSSIRFYNTDFLFTSASSGFHINTCLENSNNRLLFENDIIHIRSVSDIIIDKLNAGKNVRLNNRALSIDSEVVIYNDSIIINHAGLQFPGMKLRVNGNIKTYSKSLDLQIYSVESNISDFINLLGANQASEMAKYKLQGKAELSLSLNGPWQKGKNLLLNSQLKIRNGGILIPSLPLSISQINTNAEINTNFSNFKENLILKSEKVEALINSSPAKGSLMLENLYAPVLDLVLSGEFPARDIVNFSGLEDIIVNQGSVRLNARLFGGLQNREKYNFRDFLELNRSLNLCLKSISLEHKSAGHKINSINGNIMLADNIWIDDLSFSYLNQNIALNGRLLGLNDYLLQNSKQLDATAGIWSDKIDLNLINTLSKKTTSNDKTKPKNNIDLRLKLTLNCDSLIIGKLNTALFNGIITSAPGRISVNSFSLMALGGELSGNAGIISLTDNNYATRGWFDVSNINIHDAFRVFNNFNQTHIISENLAGSLSGTISMSALADSAYTLTKNDLSLNGNYTISDGQLINYEPIYKLSKFIDISELENIQFSKLENKLIIENNVLSIPNMEIESSAFDISINGEHSFSGPYNYHIKLLLSDILSKKEQDKNEKVSEFGIIEDDGLGRTSLFLKIEGDRSGSKISHDMTALKTDLKENIAIEKQSLKSMLNEEYGWYENDSLPEVLKDDTRRFRVVWEETDSIMINDKQSTEKKLPLIRLFNRKKKKEGRSEIK